MLMQQLKLRFRIICNAIRLNYMDGAEEKIELDYDGSILDELEDDWEVIEYSSTQIRLKDVSGGSGGTDYLYLTKN